MVNIETSYMGLQLKNPVIVGSSGLTASIEKIKKIESSGAGCIVLKSIFQEQISREIYSLARGALKGAHSEEVNYISYYIKKYNFDDYLDLIKEAKKQLSIPVIASINCSCTTSSDWIEYTDRIQNSGVDAIELNMFIMPVDIRIRGEDIEKIYFDTIKKIREKISIPISLKMSHFFSGLANFVYRVSIQEVDGIVLFNRFHSPDINLEKMQFVPTNKYSTPDEIYIPLRWVGMLSDEVECDLSASTGIHNGEGVIKCLLAGAKAVQIVSTLYKNGIDYLETIIDDIKKWMKENNYASTDQFIGKLSQSKLENPELYERAQFMKYFS